MVSYRRLVEMLHGLFGLALSEGAIANMLARAATPFAAEAERIETEVRRAAVIACDETSARVKGQTCWQWVFGSASAVTHRIASSTAVGTGINSVERGSDRVGPGQVISLASAQPRRRV